MKSSYGKKIKSFHWSFSFIISLLLLSCEPRDLPVLKANEKTTRASSSYDSSRNNKQNNSPEKKSKENDYSNEQKSSRNNKNNNPSEQGSSSKIDPSIWEPQFNIFVPTFSFFEIQKIFAFFQVVTRFDKKDQWPWGGDSSNCYRSNRTMIKFNNCFFREKDNNYSVNIYGAIEIIEKEADLILKTTNKGLFYRIRSKNQNLNLYWKFEYIFSKDQWGIVNGSGELTWDNFEAYSQFYQYFLSMKPLDSEGNQWEFINNSHFRFFDEPEKKSLNYFDAEFKGSFEGKKILSACSLDPNDSHVFGQLDFYFKPKSSLRGAIVRFSKNAITITDKDTTKSVQQFDLKHCSRSTHHSVKNVEWLNQLGFTLIR